MEGKKELEKGKASSPLHMEEEKELAGGNTPLSETWPQDAQAALEEFIEGQGIYIRQ